jgi:hypothetical protein
LTALELLHEIEARGVSLRLQLGELKLRPAASLDARVLAEVRAAKPELVELLRAREYSQRDALAALAREVAVARVSQHHVAVGPKLLAAWKNANEVCRCELTISGEPIASTRKNRGDENDEQKRSSDQVGDRGIAGAARRR